MASRESAVAAFLRQARPPVAMVAYDDMAAVAALRAAHQAGWRVPEDLSVVGIDDIQFASYTNPGLTTVAQPKHELGALAVDALLTGSGADGADGAGGRTGPAGLGTAPAARAARSARRLRRPGWRGEVPVLDGQLVIRESTAPAAHGHAGGGADDRRHAGDRAGADRHRAPGRPARDRAAPAAPRPGRRSSRSACSCCWCSPR